MANLKEFIESMIDFDKEGMKQTTINKLRDLKAKYPDDFIVEKV